MRPPVHEPLGFRLETITQARFEPRRVGPRHRRRSVWRNDHARGVWSLCIMGLIFEVARRR